MLIRFSERNVSRPAGWGATIHNGAYYNRWWGHTEAIDQHFGRVNAIWRRGRQQRLLYATIRADAPHAKVVIVDCAYLFSHTCVSSGPLEWLIAPNDLLDNVIEASAARHGFIFVDLRRPFTGHSARDQGALINHLYTHDHSKSFHPNAAGYHEVAKLIEAAL